MDIILETQTLPRQQTMTPETEAHERQERSRRIFAQEIYSHFRKPGSICTIDAIAEELKKMPTDHFRSSLYITSTNLTFEAHNLSTPEDVRKYDQRVKNLKQAHYYLTHGKEKDFGWVITIV